MTQPEHEQIILPPDAGAPEPTGQRGEITPADMLQQPAKVMRIGTMVKQLLETFMPARSTS